MAESIGMEQTLVVGKINHVSPHFIPPTFNTCIKKSIEAVSGLFMSPILN